jgi:glycyl-tRNA synthetase beta chain
MATILLEIGTEELPASYLPPALAQLREQALARLAAARIGVDLVHAWGTPRRIVLFATGVAEHQEASTHETRGPAVDAAFAANGEPTQAAIGFARSQGITPAALQIITREGGEFVAAVFRDEGRPTLEVLPELFTGLIADLAFPKTMRWASGTFRFARPIRWIVAMMDTRVVPCAVDDVVAGNATRGHRFLAPGAVPIPAAADYRRIMEENHVLVVPEARREMIEEQLRTLTLGEDAAIIDDGSLLDATTFHLEYPTALRGAFDPRFLSLPREVLLQVLRHEQDFFPLTGRDGRLLPGFIAVRNGDKAYLSSVREGYEAVAHAKLIDALFFYEQDARTPLNERVEALRGVIFQERLGTLHDKVARVQHLAGALAALLGLSAPERALAERAALLCKADLVSAMVTEHPELQGVMGGVYARLSGEAEPVAAAIGEHYRPRGAGDAIPATPLGRVLALADKLDTVVSCISVGLIPVGDDDPYALRREAAGVVRILADAGLRLSLTRLLTLAQEALTVETALAPGETLATLQSFYRARLEALLTEAGATPAITRAVLAVSADVPADALARARALARRAGDPSLAAMVRVATRLAHLGKGASVEALRPELLFESAERDLYQRVLTLAPRLEQLAAVGEYDELCNLLVTLPPAVDTFLSGVMVMTDDAALRDARLALVRRTADLFRLLADFPQMG